MFRYSICDPLRPDPIEMGEVEREKILDLLDRFPWTDLLNKMKGVDEAEVHYAPTLEMENKTNKNQLSITCRGEKGNEFYIFYTRPKTETSFFGLIKNTDDNFFSEKEGLTLNEVRDVVKALVADDLQALEKKLG